MKNDRRVFLAGAAALASTMVAGNSSAQGGSKGAGGKGWQRHAYGVSADTTNKCATCVFWGGERHVSRDHTMVHVQSLGMCNNPASANYHTITSPDTGPMKAWVKWPALGM
ncbi:MAG: hypothetical protein ACU84Q_14980 [Gammaproteobacteria bacterium]